MTDSRHQVAIARRAIAIAAVAGALTGLTSARAAAALIPVAGDRLQPLLEGTSVGLNSLKSGKPMVWNFRASGELDGTIQIDADRVGRDKGRWWLSPDNRLCYQWKKWARAKKHCMGLAIDNGNIQPLRRDGSPGKATWRIKRLGPAAGPIMTATGGSPAAGRAVASAEPPRMRSAGQDRPALQENARAPADAVRVPPRMLKSLMAGTTIETTSNSDRPMKWHFRPDGRLDGELDAPSRTVKDEGKWWATKVGTLCFQWKRFAKAKKLCSILSLSGSELYRLHPATGESRGKVWKIATFGEKSNAVVAAIRGGGGQQQQVASLTPPRNARTAASANPFAEIHFGAYHALVIGNNGYRHLAKLKSARNDAEAVAKTLIADYGFKVTKMTDATRSDILGALAKMRATLKPDDNLLIYYAGHGIVDSITEQGYWLPVDAEQQNPANWISNTDLTNMLRAIRARHVMVVADSCYSGTLVRAASAKMKTSRDKVAWVKRMLGKRGRTALVSGGLEPVVDSGTGTDHSVFAQAFITALKENREVLEGHALFDRIKRPIVLNANQTPQYSDIRLAGHEGGEFVFVRKALRSR